MSSLEIHAFQRYCLSHLVNPVHCVFSFTILKRRYASILFITLKQSLALSPSSPRSWLHLFFICLLLSIAHLPPSPNSGPPPLSQWGFGGTAPHLVPVFVINQHLQVIHCISCSIRLGSSSSMFYLLPPPELLVNKHITNLRNHWGTYGEANSRVQQTAPWRACTFKGWLMSMPKSW